MDTAWTRPVPSPPPLPPRNRCPFLCYFLFPTHLAPNLATDKTRIAQNRQRRSRAPPRGRQSRPKHWPCWIRTIVYMDPTFLRTFIVCFPCQNACSSSFYISDPLFDLAPIVIPSISNIAARFRCRQGQSFILSFLSHFSHSCRILVS